MKPLVRLGIGGKSTYLLTTIGRRTGQERTTPVILVENDGITMAWLPTDRCPEFKMRYAPSQELRFATADQRKVTIHAEEVYL